MARGRTAKFSKAAKNPQASKILSGLMDSAFVKNRLETATRQNIDKIFDGDKIVLKELTSDVITEFRMDSFNDIKTTLLSPSDFSSIKTEINTLPDYSKDCVSRIIVVVGSHEVFTTAGFMSQDIFVPQGSSVKVNPIAGKMTFNNRGYYDKTKFEGKGFKRPESRYIIIFDFCSTDSEIIEAERSREISSATQGLNNPGLFDSIKKMLN